MSLTSPIRNPNLRDPAVMGKRAWWLILLSLFLPGTAQLVAGNRRLGRVLFGTWLAIAALVVAAGIAYLSAPGVVLSLIMSIAGLWVVQVLLVVVAVLSLVSAVDTFRLVRFVYVPSRTKLAVALVTIFALVVPTGASAYGAYLSGVTRDAFAGIFADKAGIAPVDGKYTFMLVGSDAGDDRFGMRTDSVTFATIDADTGQLAMVGIPRNLYYAPFVKGSPMLTAWPDGFNCGDECLLTYIYHWAQRHKSLYPDAEANGSTPGLEALRDSVEAIVGIPVQFYVMVDMDGFRRLIDALGGVDIDIPDVTHVCVVGEPITYTFQPGPVHLGGRLALMYARTRCDTNDFDRMARQKQIEEAILRQAKPLTVLTKFQELAAAGKALFKSDLPQSMIGTMLDLGAKAKKLELRKEDLVPPQFDYLHPNFAVARQIVNEIVFPPPATPSPTPPK